MRLPFPRTLVSRVHALVVLAAAVLRVAADDAFPVRIEVDAARPIGPLKPIWRFFGADEPNYAPMKDGRKLLGELGAIGPRQTYFRAHNLLTSGDGTPAFKWGSTGAYSEDPSGRPLYNWSVVDRILDTYLERGVRPYVEVGFMPREMSRKPDPYQHAWRPGLPYDEVYTGWAQPPRDLNKWEQLVFEWTRHCVEKWGRAEVERWYWETWNEANIGYWKGTPAEFRDLHDHAIAGIRRALPTARVGGPDCAGFGGDWMRAFLEHCLRGTNHATGRVGTPIDFVSFHAKGSPVYTNGHVRMGIAAQLREIDRGFALVASFPELKSKPIVIGESDPEGCAACQGPQLAYRNGTMYSSYTAASFARKMELADRHGVNLEGALTWAFEFEDQPYFAGFRSLATCGIDLPVLNVFRMFGEMHGDRVAVSSSGAVALDDILRGGVRAAPDVSALAAVGDKTLSLLAWHYHDDDIAGPPAATTLVVKGLPVSVNTARARLVRVDDEHANAFAAWRKMGSPPAPNRSQYDALTAASALMPDKDFPASIKVEGGIATITLTLPRQGVALVSLDWD